MKHLYLPFLAVILGAAAPPDGLVTLSTDYDFATLEMRTKVAIETGGLRMIGGPVRARPRRRVASPCPTMPC